MSSSWSLSPRVWGPRFLWPARPSELQLEASQSELATTTTLEPLLATLTQFALVEAAAAAAATATAAQGQLSARQQRRPTRSGLQSNQLFAEQIIVIIVIITAAAAAAAVMVIVVCLDHDSDSGAKLRSGRAGERPLSTSPTVDFRGRRRRHSGATCARSRARISDSGQRTAIGVDLLSFRSGPPPLMIHWLCKRSAGCAEQTGVAREEKMVIFHSARLTNATGRTPVAPLSRPLIPDPRPTTVDARRSTLDLGPAANGCVLRLEILSLRLLGRDRRFSAGRSGQRQRILWS